MTWLGLEALEPKPKHPSPALPLACGQREGAQVKAAQGAALLFSLLPLAWEGARRADGGEHLILTWLWA